MKHNVFICIVIFEHSKNTGRTIEKQIILFEIIGISWKIEINKWKIFPFSSFFRFLIEILKI